MRLNFLMIRLAAFALCGAVLNTVAHAEVVATISRKAWSFDRAELLWLDAAQKQDAEKKGIIGVAGWAEYDFEIAKAGWFELWIDTPSPASTRDLYIDGKLEQRLMASDPDRDVDGAWCKETNLYLSAGKHTLRYRRLEHPAGLPKRWELRASTGPAGAVRVISNVKDRVVRSGEPVHYTVVGGADRPSEYAVAVQKIGESQPIAVGQVHFDKADAPQSKELSITFPSQGVWQILATSDNQPLRPADFKTADVIAIDTNEPAAPATVQKTLVCEIDCVAKTVNGKAAADGKDFFELYGPSAVVHAPFGDYRQSNGRGPNANWALDGFSFHFSLPKPQTLYKLEVDYPDDDRRSMGFWINDGSTVNNINGQISTGGVETGDAYPLSHRMQTHEAYFYPRKTDQLVMAFLNLTPAASGAAASKVRIYQVDGPLPAATKIETNNPRLIANYFEEPGRWIKHFGGDDDSAQSNLTSLDRWGQYARFEGARLLWPTMNVYQANYYPSDVLEGYFCRPYNFLRATALIAQRYGCQFVPEYHLSGTPWFDQQVMGVIRVKDGNATTIQFRDAEAEQCVVRSNTGDLKFARKPFVYNALNPKVQQVYLDALGEAADSVADCPSFSGVSSRLMLTWQWMGFNALPGLKYGYEDWTIALFEKETGIAVPGGANDPERYRIRFEFLTGPKKAEWNRWRCKKIFEFHCRLRDRLRKAKPGATLYLTSPETESSFTLSANPMDQLIEMGIDPKLYEGVDGITIVPCAPFGRRYSTPVADAVERAATGTEFFKTLSSIGQRGVLLWSQYFEANANLDWSKLGGTPYGAFDSCTPSADNERELYARALADDDVQMISIGANGTVMGRAAWMAEWTKRFNAIPATPFKRAKVSQDPVAVWEADVADGHCIYVVNRLSTAVNVRLKIANAASVLTVGDSTPLAMNSTGEIAFPLEPFMLQVFRVKGAAVVVDSCHVDVPAPFADQLQRPLQFVRSLKEGLLNRQILPELSQQDSVQAVALIDRASAAAAAGEWAAVKDALIDPMMVRVYDSIGRYPPGLFERQVPLGYTDAANAPTLTPSPVNLENVNSIETVQRITAMRFDSAGTLWVAADGRMLQFGATGKDQRSLQLLGESEYRDGGLRSDRIGPPVAAEIRSFTFAPNGDIVAVSGNALNRFETRFGRRFEGDVGRGPWAVLPAKSGSVIAGPDSAGDFFIGGATGVRTVGKDGRILLTDDSAAPQVSGPFDVDSVGKVFSCEGGKLTIYSPDGKVQATFKLAIKANRIAVSPNGDRAVVADASSIQIIDVGRSGSVISQAKFPEGIAAVAISADKRVAVALQSPRNGMAVLVFTSDDLQMANPLSVASAPAATGMIDPTPLKSFKGQLFYRNGARLCEINPGEQGSASVAMDASDLGSEIIGFDFCENGDVVLRMSGAGKSAAEGTLAIAKYNGTSWSQPTALRQMPAATGAVPADIAVCGSDVIAIDPTRATGMGEKPPKSLLAWPLNGGGQRALAALGGTAGDEGYGFCRGSDGRLFIADASRAITCLDSSGKIIWQQQFQTHRSHGVLPLRGPIAAAVDSAGHLWIADSAAGQILCLNAVDGTFLSSFGWRGSIGADEFTALFQPSGLCCIHASDGDWLYVADTGNRRLLRFKIGIGTSPKPE